MEIVTRTQVILIAVIIVVAALVALYPSASPTAYATKNRFYVSYPYTAGAWCKDSDGNNIYTKGIVQVQYISLKTNNAHRETVEEQCTLHKMRTPSCTGKGCTVRETVCKLPTEVKSSYDTPYTFEYIPCKRCAKGVCLLR